MEVFGTITKIIKHDFVSQYTIFEFTDYKLENNVYLIKSPISPALPGTSFVLQLNKEESEDFYTINSYELVNVPDIENYNKCAKLLLTNPPFNFSKSDAMSIIRKFKTNTIDRVLNYPKDLFEIDKLDRNKILEIIERLEVEKDIIELSEFLKKFHIPSSYSVNLYEFYGTSALRVLKTQPIKPFLDGVLKLSICRFLSNQQNIPISSMDNVACIIIQSILSFELQGHTCIEIGELNDYILKKYKLKKDELKKGINYCLANNYIVFKKSSDKLFVFRFLINKNEDSIAEQIVSLKGTFSIDFDLNEEIERVEKELDLKFSTEQKNGIKNAFKNSISIITGPAGCGKTLVLSAITKIFKRRFGGHVLLCAPTGKAANRMTESTGMSAYTVHSSLNLTPVFEGEDIFDSNIILNHDLILLDESSMADLELASIFFRGVKKGARVVLLGDSNQLPSVGCGDVLQQLIDSGLIPVTFLTSIYRQDSRSSIVVNANKIKDLDYDLIYDDSFSFIEATTDKEARNLAISEFLSIAPAIGKNNIALLTPFRHSTILGCNSLNLALEPVLNPEAKKVYNSEHGIFKKGDTVLRTQNDNKTGVVNGSIGVISDISSVGFLVDFGNGKSLFYGFDEFENFELAYANTIHKSQGSEYDTVILVVMPEHEVMLYNNILYTAITRAKKRVIIIGQPETLKKGILKKSELKRNTLLAQRIKEKSLIL